MNRNPALRAAALIGAGVLLALVANAFAPRQRRLALVGSYPNALRVPPREAVLATPSPSRVSVVPNTPPPTVAPPTPTPTAAPATTTQPTATAAIETVGLNPAVKTSTAIKPPPAMAAATTTTPPVPHDAPPTPAADRFTPHPDKPYVEIGYADVSALHAKNVLFLDARRTSVYEQGHIAGARSYSVWESDVDEKVTKLFAERSDPREQALPIVIYCSGGECEDSHMLAQKLWGIQFNNIYVYKDGFPDWQQHGGAVHTGAAP